MTGLFKVCYFDPKRARSNVHAVRVVASNAEDAIRKASLLAYERLLERLGRDPYSLPYCWSY